MLRRVRRLRTWYTLMVERWTVPYREVYTIGQYFDILLRLKQRNEYHP